MQEDAASDRPFIAALAISKVRGEGSGETAVAVALVGLTTARYISEGMPFNLGWWGSRSRSVRLLLWPSPDRLTLPA
jgi:hypothetical protein